VPESDRLRVFFDADALIAGSASATGASNVLLRLSEVGVIEGITSTQAVREVELNLAEKLPAALPAFRALIKSALGVVPNPGPQALLQARHLADAKDAPILAAALENHSDYLVTFNVRHYRHPAGGTHVTRPGPLVERFRQSLARMG
jgi:predicted nucleic acid-binding protein